MSRDGSAARAGRFGKLAGVWVNVLGFCRPGEYVFVGKHWVADTAEMADFSHAGLQGPGKFSPYFSPRPQHA